MAEIEIRGGDFNSFDDARPLGRHAASLSEATGGELDRSLRHRELRRPNGFGDELRAALVGDAATWGGLTLLRGADRGRLLPRRHGRSSPPLRATLAEGLRRAMLLTALAAERERRRGAAGLVLLAADNSITHDGRGRRAVARRAAASGRGRAAPAGGRRRGEPRAQHRGRGAPRRARRAGARPHGLRALAARARLDARRRRRRADGRDHRARPAARARAARSRTPTS